MRILLPALLLLLLASPCAARDLAGELQARLTAAIEARASVELAAHTTALLEAAQSREPVHPERSSLARSFVMLCRAPRTGPLRCDPQPWGGAASPPAAFSDSR